MTGSDWPAWMEPVAKLCSALTIIVITLWVYGLHRRIARLEAMIQGKGKKTP